MAVRYAVATGNWSSTATWDGGTLPTASDDVYSNNKTVTIDQNVTVLSLNNQAQAPAVAGGTFVVNANNLTITANLTYTAGDCLSTNNTGNLTIIGNVTGISTPLGYIGVRHFGTGTINITGNITGGQGNSSHGISCSTGAIINITGNVTGGSGVSTHGISIGTTTRVSVNGTITGGTNTGNGINVGSTSSTALTLTGACISGATTAINNTTTGTVTINTSQTASGTASVYMITNSSTGIININGDCLGALSSAPSTALILNNSGAGTVNISGNVTARSVSPSTTNGIVNNTSTGTINVSGNVSGGSVANTIGMGNGSSGTINVTGNITGGSNATNTPAIYSTTAGTIDVTGSCSADANPALWSTSTTAVNRLRGDVTNKNGISAYFAVKINISPSAAQQFTLQDTSNANRILATSNISPGVPLASNVRFGTVYGSLGEYTGTLRVPNPNTVLLGNLTDNTTGTLLMTPSDFWNAATSGMTTAGSVGKLVTDNLNATISSRASQTSVDTANTNINNLPANVWDKATNTLTTSGSIGERLKNASTVQTTGDQLASYQV